MLDINFLDMSVIGGAEVVSFWFGWSLHYHTTYFISSLLHYLNIYLVTRL